jgi:hypothetical protein
MKRIEHGPDVTGLENQASLESRRPYLVSDVELAAIVGKLEEVR